MTRRCAGLTVSGVQDFARLTVEEALLEDCRVQRSPEEIAGAQRSWSPIPPHPSQTVIHQLAIGPTTSHPDRGIRY